MLKTMIPRAPATRASRFVTPRFLNAALQNAAALFLVAALAAAIFGSARFVNGALNADSLLPASFWWDALNQPAGLWHHQTARIPSLLPDMAAYGALFALTGSFAASTVAYGTLQLLLLVYAAGLLIARLAGVPLASGTLVAASLLTAQGAVALNEGDWNGLGAVLPVFHTGPFALSILGLALARSLTQRSTPGLLAGLAATASLAFLSDMMLLVTFVGPVAIAAALLWAGGKLSRAALVRILAALAVGLALGALALRLIQAAGLSIGPAPSIHPARFAASISTFIVGIPAYVAQFPGHAAILALLYGAALAVAAIAIRDPGLHRIAPGTLLIWLVAIFGSAATLAFTAVLYEDAGAYRYITPLSVWPVLVLSPPIMRVLSMLPRLAPVLATISAALLLPPGISPSALTDFATPTATCLRRWRAPLALHAALAGYWQARPAMIALHWSMQIDQVTSDGRPLLWANDPTLYRSAVSTPTRPPLYDAIIVDSLDPSAIESRYGPPASIYQCDAITLWHYPDGAEIQRRLVAPGR